MSEWELVIIAIAAVVTAAITAVAGAGGGVVLLIVFLLFVDPIVAVPAHGIVQLASNGTRAVSLRSDVETHMLRWYLAPLIPATIAGYFIADAIPRSSGRAIVGVFALLAVWWPTATAWLSPKVDGDMRRFSVVGTITGLLNPTIGAPGPLISPAFRAVTSNHVAFVATFSLVQTIGHLVKVGVFMIAGVALADHVPMIVVAAAGVILGTRVGVRYVRRLDEQVLGAIFKFAVTAGALRLISSLVT